MPKTKPLVSVIMGSDSDLEVMSGAVEMLEQFAVPFEVRVVSAHRTPVWMFDFARKVEARGVQVIVAGAGGAAHLPGMVASITSLPVIGVPVALEGKTLQGIDSLYSIVQMPKGVPVATMAVNGAANAGLFAIRILALHDEVLRGSLTTFHQEFEEFVHEKDAKVRKQFMPDEDFED